MYQSVQKSGERRTRLCDSTHNINDQPPNKEVDYLGVVTSIHNLLTERDFLVDEQEFWERLEYRVCGELAGMEDRDLRALWCDGFIPRQLLIDDGPPRIIGYAWMAIGAREQDQWNFIFYLPTSVRSQIDLEWQELLPPEDLTEWLEIDRTKKELRIHPTNLTYR
jgi:hypothetical protein